MWTIPKRKRPPKTSSGSPKRSNCLACLAPLLERRSEKNEVASLDFTDNADNVDYSLNQDRVENRSLGTNGFRKTALKSRPGGPPILAFTPIMVESAVQRTIRGAE